MSVPCGLTPPPCLGFISILITISCRCVRDAGSCDELAPLHERRRLLHHHETRPLKVLRGAAFLCELPTPGRRARHRDTVCTGRGCRPRLGRVPPVGWGEGLHSRRLCPACAERSVSARKRSPRD